jgi:hypothetical protein
VPKKLENLNLHPAQKKTRLWVLWWRGSQVVRQGSAKASSVGSIPTLASNQKLFKISHLQMPEEAGASESASEINTGLPPLNHPGIPRQPLGKDGLGRPFV